METNILKATLAILLYSSIARADEYCTYYYEGETREKYCPDDDTGSGYCCDQIWDEIPDCCINPTLPPFSPTVPPTDTNDPTDTSDINPGVWIGLLIIIALFCFCLRMCIRQYSVKRRTIQTRQLLASQVSQRTVIIATATTNTQPPTDVTSTQDRPYEPPPSYQNAVQSKNYPHPNYGSVLS